MRAGEIAFRTIRGGRWRSVVLSDLDVLTDQDLALQRPRVAADLRRAVEADVRWLRDEPGACWRRVPEVGS